MFEAFHEIYQTSYQFTVSVCNLCWRIHFVEVIDEVSIERKDRGEAVAVGFDLLFLRVETLLKRLTQRYGALFDTRKNGGDLLKILLKGELAATAVATTAGGRHRA